MIVSNDQKSVFIANPKTGTITAHTLLKDYGIPVGTHTDLSTTIMRAKVKNNSFDYNLIENAYVFWRDPVQRFISGVNYLRTKAVEQLMIRNPEWFSDFSYLNLRDNPPNPGQNLPRITITAAMEQIASSITPEQLFNAHTTNKTVNPTLSYLLLEKQSRWVSNNMIVLNYSNFDTNMRTVMNSFGVPSSTQIPRNNVSEKLTTSLSSELEARVREYYAEDYALQPVS